MKFRISSFALSRLLRVANRGFLYVKGPEETVRVKVSLRRGWQLVGLNLIGSKPTRPSDVIPGEPDSRPLVVSIGPISIDGPRGSSEVCARPTRLDDIPTVG